MRLLVSWCVLLVSLFLVRSDGWLTYICYFLGRSCLGGFTFSFKGLRVIEVLSDGTREILMVGELHGRERNMTVVY